MIGYLRGKILDAGPDSLLLDVGGVGYQLAIPLSTFSQLDRADRTESVGLFVHTHVRADAIELFGFWTARERSLFALLIGVSGIGPRLARVVLSGMAAEELVRALASENAVQLATIPGIGKKTAQRMVIELKDKVLDLGIDLAGSVAFSPDDDLLAALVNLGYRSGDAEKALAKARRETPDADPEDLLRASLNFLSRV
ncbi:MAG: Holliday junction branch migration protein RuvA [Acidobacteria bacterium]|nr:Holliday junction branch migration protein RuvA [Acidobacteriota bacterium]